MLQRLGFPPLAGNGRFVAALAIDAVGSGVWIPLSMLYFLHQTPLSLLQVGVAVSVANLASVPVVPLIGSMVDRLGPKAVMQLGNAGSASAFALYPFAHAFWSVAGLVFVASVTRSLFWGALSPMVVSLTSPGQRERWFGFTQAMRNAGYGVGGILASLALVVGTSAAYQAVVLANAASYLAAFALLVAVRSGGRVPRPAGPRVRWGAWVAFTDPGYRWLVGSTLCYALVAGTLNVAIPVYFVRSLGLPGWVPGTVFVINTAMIGLGQGLVVNVMAGRVRVHVLHTSIVLSALSFLVFWSASWAGIAFGVVVVLVAVVVYTLGEMTTGPVLGAMSAEAPPDHLRGRYVAATQLAWSLAGAASPVLFSSLLSLGPATLWLGCVALCVVWTLVVRMVGARLPLATRRVAHPADPAVAQA